MDDPEHVKRNLGYLVYLPSEGVNVFWHFSLESLNCPESPRPWIEVGLFFSLCGRCTCACITVSWLEIPYCRHGNNSQEFPLTRVHREWETDDFPIPDSWWSCVERRTVTAE